MHSYHSEDDYRLISSRELTFISESRECNKNRNVDADMRIINATRDMSNGDVVRVDDGQVAPAASTSPPTMAPSPSHRGAHLLFLAAATVFNRAYAYTWSFQETPTQCGNLTVAVSGSDGTPPYRILIIPFGPSPLANNIEARRIMDIPFSNSDTKVEFQLQYPGDSQFVAVVSVISQTLRFPSIRSPIFLECCSMTFLSIFSP